MTVTRARRLSLLFATFGLLFLLVTAIVAGKGTPAGKAAVSVCRDGSVLVIDAGHGGLDGGAVSADGRKESVINLAIAQKLALLCRFFGQSCVMTRSTEEFDYPAEAVSIHDKKVWDQQRRVALVNATADALLISIHQNKYPDARPSGVQVLYAASAGSDAFAELTHENLRRALCPESRRVAIPAGSAIYLMKHVQCPAILAECGFLSNPDEAAKLSDPSYQTKLATILCASCMQFIGAV